jgi:hypothetical protein
MLNKVLDVTGKGYDFQQAAEKLGLYTTSMDPSMGADVKMVEGRSKRLSSKAAASKEARRTLRYVEPLSEARTPLADFFSILLGAELNALRQRQIVTPIGGVRLTPHIGFPGIRAGFAPSAGFLFASKGAADLRA